MRRRAVHLEMPGRLAADDVCRQPFAVPNIQYIDFFALEKTDAVADVCGYGNRADIVQFCGGNRRAMDFNSKKFADQCHRLHTKPKTHQSQSPT